MKSTIKTLHVEQLIHVNQFVITDSKNKRVYFQSYNSMIAMRDDWGNLHLSKLWNYSSTTLRHLYVFIHDWCACEYNMICNSKNKKKAIAELIKQGLIKLDLEA